MPGTHIVDPRKVVVSRQAVETTVTTPDTHSQSAYRLLHAGYAILPIVAGADKFFHYLTDWDQYLAPRVAKLLPASVGPHKFMLIVGAIEIVAGLCVAVVPRFGAFLVSAWLLGIMGNLLLQPYYYDIALRDFGLAIGAFALGLLALGHRRATVVEDRPPLPAREDVGPSES